MRCNINFGDHPLVLTSTYGLHTYLPPILRAGLRSRGGVFDTLRNGIQLSFRLNLQTSKGVLKIRQRSAVSGVVDTVGWVFGWYWCCDRNQAGADWPVLAPPARRRPCVVAGLTTSNKIKNVDNTRRKNNKKIPQPSAYISPRSL